MTKRVNGGLFESAAASTMTWLDERIDLSSVMHWLKHKTVPVHRHGWIYFLGGAAMFLFALQVATGCLMMLYYQPTEASAHASVQKIMTVVPYGWLIRSVHVWGAHFFVAATFLHFLTVLFSRAYRKPRELTWVSGMVLLGLTLTLGFSGYLLPWTELSYHATMVGTSIPEAVPGVGQLVTHLLRGGTQISGDTITRFFAAHVAIVPMALGAVLGLHLLLVQLQGMSLPLGLARKQVRDERPFFGEFLYLDAGLWLLLLGALATLAVWIPAEIGPQANPLQPAPVGIKPEWYFLFMFQTLKCVPETLGVAFFALCGLFLLLVPWMDRKASRESRSPVFTIAFVGLLTYAAIFEAWAWWTPGVSGTKQELVADTYKLATLIPWLILLWVIIAFLLYYLLQFVRQTARIRRLHRDGDREAVA